MRCALLIHLILGTLTLWVVADEQQYRVSIEHGRATVRVLPDETADPVATLAFGTEVTALAVDTPAAADTTWLRIQAPEEVSLWIYADLLRDGHVAVNNARARTGAGIHFKAVATLQRDTPVAIRGRLGDWIRIKPPPETALWISRKEVEPLAHAPERDTSVDPHQSEAHSSAPEATPFLPVEIAGLPLLPDRRQGAPVIRRGRLDWPSHWERNLPAACSSRLATVDGQAAVLIIDRDEKMLSHIGQSVMITGTIWYLKEVTDPILISETILPR